MPHTASTGVLNESVLGRYRIVEKLARGGMGAVYLGRTEGAAGFTRPVVIKRVLPALMDDEEVAQMFVREARILSNLQHPNIVSVLDFGQQRDGAYVMVLEYVHGYQLADWTRFVQQTRGQVPFEFALYIMTRVLDALHYAHTFTRGDGTSMRIVHRDISPTNVLLTEQADVKLLDFGIARVSGDEGAFLTGRPRVKGKLPYLALEIFKGAEPSERSDVYSAGVVLYELLTGLNPFLGKQTADIYDKILHTTPPSVHASRDDAPEAIDEVLARAMHKDVFQRYDSAAAFAADLRALRSGPEEPTVEALRRTLQADFAGPMPQELSLPPLSARDAAWRGGQAQGGADDDDLTQPLALSDPAPGARTVAGSVPPELMAAAGGRPKPSIPTLPAPAADTASGTPAPRRGLYVLAGLLVIAAFALSLWSVLGGRQEVVIVQQRATPSPSQAAPEASAAATTKVVDEEPAQQQAPEPQAEAVAAKAAAVERSAEKPPPPPRPRQLTRAFGRRQTRVQACFTKHADEVTGAPDLAIDFEVHASGRVKSAKVLPARIAATPLGQCLARVARGTYFGPQQHAVAFHIPIKAERR